MLLSSEIWMTWSTLIVTEVQGCVTGLRPPSDCFVPSVVQSLAKPGACSFPHLSTEVLCPFGVLSSVRGSPQHETTGKRLRGRMSASTGVPSLGPGGGQRNARSQGAWSQVWKEEIR